MIQTPTLSAHNLVMGEPYLDIGDKATVTRVNGSGECIINFYRRNWIGTSNDFKVDGKVFLDNKESGVSLEGLWNKSINLIDERSHTR